MYLTYNGHLHKLDEMNVERFQRFPKYSPRHARMTALHRMEVSGELQYFGQGPITAAIQANEQAYNFDRAGDFGLLQDDGTKTPHFLSDADSINGVRIMFYEYPQGDAAEYASKRTVRIVAEAEYLAADEDIYSFEETLQFIGNTGPIWEFELVCNGPAIPVQRTQRSVQQVIQSGRIVGLVSYMGAPPPVFINGQHGERFVYTPESPVKYGNLWLNWPESYAYHFSFSADSSASASPTIL